MFVYLLFINFHLSYKSCTRVHKFAAFHLYYLNLTIVSLISPYLFFYYFYLTVFSCVFSLVGIGALSYAELGTVLTESGGEYSYFLETFAPNQATKNNYRKKKNKDDSSSDDPAGKEKKKADDVPPAHMHHRGEVDRGAWYQPIPAFLFSWVSVLLLKPSSMAIICLTFAEYLARIYGTGCNEYIPPQLTVKLLACCCISELTPPHTSPTPPPPHPGEWRWLSRRYHTESVETELLHK